MLVFFNRIFLTHKLQLSVFIQSLQRTKTILYIFLHNTKKLVGLFKSRNSLCQSFISYNSFLFKARPQSFVSFHKHSFYNGEILIYQFWMLEFFVTSFSHSKNTMFHDHAVTSRSKTISYIFLHNTITACRFIILSTHHCNSLQVY